MNTALAGIGFLLSVLAPPMDTPSVLLQQATELCEAQEYGDAIVLYDRILEASESTSEANKADWLADECLRDLWYKNDGTHFLEEIVRVYPGRRIAAKALLALVRNHLYREMGCADVSLHYSRLIHSYPGTLEAARGITARAVCLSTTGGLDVATRDLEAVADQHAGTPDAAWALYWLGMTYQGREERDRAAIYYQRLLEEYPADLEYPQPGGLRIVESAQLSLKLLDQFVFSPIFDKLHYWLDRQLMRGLIGVDSLDSNEYSIPLTPYVVKLGSLILVLLALTICQLQSLSPSYERNPLFRRKWNLRTACGLLIGVWTLELLSQFVMVGSLGSERLSVEGYILLGKLFTLTVLLVVFAVTLWREPLSRLFAVRRGLLLWMSVAALGGALAYGLVLRLSSQVPRWLGLVDPEESARRYLYREGFHSGEHLAWAIFMVVLAVIGEELLFRGVLYEMLMGRSVKGVAALLSSFLFALVHVGPIHYTVAFFCFGLILVFLREKYRSLTPPVLCHGVLNLLYLAASR